MNWSVRFGMTSITGPKVRFEPHIPKIQASIEKDLTLTGVSWSLTHETQGDQTTLTVHVPKVTPVKPGEFPEDLAHEAHLVFLIHDAVTRVPKGAPKSQGGVDVEVSSDCLLTKTIQNDFKRGPYADV